MCDGCKERNYLMHCLNSLDVILDVEDTYVHSHAVLVLIYISSIIVCILYI